ncbi:MAG: lipopolysaccharide heptosyltransferase II [Thermodesulfovibrionales bacterium]
MSIKRFIKSVFVRLGNLYFQGMPPRTLPLNPGKILVFTRMAIGDMIMAMPSFAALRQSYPEACITLCSMRWNKDIVRPMHYFNKVILLDDAAAMQRDYLALIKFIFELRRVRYDMVVTFDSFMFPFYFFLAGIPVRIGFEYGDEGFALTHKVKFKTGTYLADTFLSVAELAGARRSGSQLGVEIEMDANEQEEIDELLRLDVFAGHARIVGIVPGGGSNPGKNISAKNWTVPGFSAVIEKLIKDCDIPVVLFGRGAADQSIAEQIIELVKSQAPNLNHALLLNLVDKTSLMQAAVLLGKCALVLTNDTSLMHLAAAVGTPTVSIFGPTDPANLAPRGGQHRYVRATLPCSPCYEQKGFRQCGSDCMQSISWQSVYAEIAAQLGSSGVRDEGGRPV